MARPIDDTQTLDQIADAIVSGSAKHVTGAIRALGIPRGHHDERRLLKKWAAGSEMLLLLANGRRRERQRNDQLIAEYHRGHQDGWDEAFRLVGKVYGSAVPANVLYRPTEAEIAATDTGDSRPSPAISLAAAADFAGYIERGSDEAFREMARPSWWSRLFMWGR